MALERVRTKKSFRYKFRLFKTLVMQTLLFIVCFVGFLFQLNDLFFHIKGVPSSADVVRFFGCGFKPCSDLKSGEASVSFIDVGQGDCTLIRTGTYNILIDSGETEYGDKVVGALEYNNIDHLDLVIVSHPHSDHYGGMYNVMLNIDVGLFIMPEVPQELVPRGLAYKQMLTVIDYKNISARYAKPGERFLLGDNCYLDIMSPVYYDHMDLNDFSIAVKFVHGDVSFLITGDLQKFSELDLLESGADIDADVLKVGHHGSAGASCEEFLRAVSPKIAVFSVAEYNFYRHPRVDVIERLLDVDCNISYSTANNGSIEFVSNGHDLRVKVEKAKALVLGE